MGVLYIFWVRGRAIGKGIDFHDFGIRNDIDFRNFRNWYRVGYAFSENWYKVGYTFLKNWCKVGYTLWKNWYKERVWFWNLDDTSPSKIWSSTPPPRDEIHRFNQTSLSKVLASKSAFFFALKECTQGISKAARLFSR